MSLLLTLEHAYCKKSQLLRGTFCFTQVQGPNALTTLLHLADVNGRDIILRLFNAHQRFERIFCTHTRTLLQTQTARMFQPRLTQNMQLGHIHSQSGIKLICLCFQSYKVKI